MKLCLNPVEPRKLLLARESGKSTERDREDALARTPMELIFLFVSHDKDDNAVEAPTCLGSNLHVIG